MPDTEQTMIACILTDPRGHPYAARQCVDAAGNILWTDPEVSLVHQTLPNGIVQEGVQTVYRDGRGSVAWFTVTVPPEVVAAQAAAAVEALAADVRAERTARLAACDWRALPDAPGDHAAGLDYRQALRDITEQSGFPSVVQWPAPRA